MLSRFLFDCTRKVILNPASASAALRGERRDKQTDTLCLYAQIWPQLWDRQTVNIYWHSEMLQLRHIMFKFSVMVQVKGHSKYKKSVETLYIYLQTSQQYTRALSNASLAKHLTLTFKVKVDLVKCVNKPYWVVDHEGHGENWITDFGESQSMSSRLSHWLHVIFISIKNNPHILNDLSLSRDLWPSACVNRVFLQQTGSWVHAG